MTTGTFGQSPIPCPQCGYDLRATALGGACPECGLLVQAMQAGIRVDGRHLVIRPDTTLPNRCIKTNEPVEHPPRTKTLYWAHPAWLLLILVNIIVLLIVYLLVQKKCRVTFSISRAQRDRIRARTTVSLLVLVAGVAAIVVGAFQQEPIVWVICGIIGAFIGLILTFIVSRPLHVAKEKNGEFWIAGCGKEFLDSIHTTSSVLT